MNALFGCIKSGTSASLVQNILVWSLEQTIKMPQGYDQVKLLLGSSDKKQLKYKSYRIFPRWNYHDGIIYSNTQILYFPIVKKDQIYKVIFHINSINNILYINSIHLRL